MDRYPDPMNDLELVLQSLNEVASRIYDLVESDKELMAVLEEYTNAYLEERPQLKAFVSESLEDDMKRLFALSHAFDYIQETIEHITEEMEEENRERGRWN